MRFFTYLGRVTLAFLEQIGAIAIFLFQVLVWLPRRPFFTRELFKQMDFIGIRSSTVILLTGMFTGMVTALQSHYGFRLFGAESLVGSTTALAQELGAGPGGFDGHRPGRFVHVGRDRHQWRHRTDRTP